MTNKQAHIRTIKILGLFFTLFVIIIAGAINFPQAAAIIVCVFTVSACLFVVYQTIFDTIKRSGPKR